MDTHDLKKLAEPFPAADIEWRIQRAGTKGDKPWAMVLAYVTNRAIQDRLDDVCGPASWRNEFIAGPGGGVLCGLSILANDEWITKWDGSDNTDIEAVKGGLSGAMKRAAVHWGIGRYLYNLDANWANIHSGGAHYQPKDKQGKYLAFKWDPPELPSWAVPEGKSGPVSRPQEPESNPTRAPEPPTKETDKAPDLIEAEAAFNDAWASVMEAIGEDDADNITALRRKFFKATTENSKSFLAMADSTAGMSVKEVRLATAMVTKGKDKVAGLCAGEWRKELKLPSLGVETCPGCAEILSPKEKEDSITVGLDKGWCEKCRPQAVVQSWR